MNFLAHLYLSGSSQPILIGNFIGDFVKGKAYQDYSEGIQKGIWLHREIDSYTDSHPQIRKCRKQLWTEFGHYAGVVIDLFNDHFLAAEWHNYSAIPLDEYARDIYRIMKSNLTILPEKAQHMLPFMIEGNWLVSYSAIRGIDRALTGLSHRASFESNMENASAELERNYLFYKTAFSKFFPELMKFVADKNEYFTLPDLY